MTDSPTCEPPPEHSYWLYHWLKRQGEEPEPVRWHDGARFWERAGYWLDPMNMHAAGYRYVGPAIPPQEGE